MSFETVAPSPEAFAGALMAIHLRELLVLDPHARVQRPRGFVGIDDLTRADDRG